MKSILSRIVIGLLGCGLVLLCAGCPSEIRNGSNGTIQPEVNTSAAPSIKCEGMSDQEIVDAIYQEMKKDKGLKDQVNDVVINYSKGALYVEGYIYGETNVENFQSILSGVGCAETISYKFMYFKSKPEIDPGTVCSRGLCPCIGGCSECPCWNKMMAPSPTQIPAPGKNVPPATKDN